MRRIKGRLVRSVFHFFVLPDVRKMTDGLDVAKKVEELDQELKRLQEEKKALEAALPKPKPSANLTFWPDYERGYLKQLHNRVCEFALGDLDALRLYAPVVPNCTWDDDAATCCTLRNGATPRVVYVDWSSRGQTHFCTWTVDIVAKRVTCYGHNGTRRFTDPVKEESPMITGPLPVVDTAASGPSTTVGTISLKEAPNVTDAQGRKQGPWLTRYPSGRLRLECTYKDDEYDGPGTSWHENGRQYAKFNYKDGLLDGVYESWHESGKPMMKCTYKSGKRVPDETPVPVPEAPAALTVAVPPAAPTPEPATPEPEKPKLSFFQAVDELRRTGLAAHDAVMKRDDARRALVYEHLQTGWRTVMGTATGERLKRPGATSTDAYDPVECRPSPWLAIRSAALRNETCVLYCKHKDDGWTSELWRAAVRHLNANGVWCSGISDAEGTSYWALRWELSK